MTLASNKPNLRLPGLKMRVGAENNANLGPMGRGDLALEP
jgi:hypothetical protein